MQKTNTQLILQDNVYETYNTELVDICLGLGVSCNMGSLQKYDRLSKVYRAIEIVKERDESVWIIYLGFLYYNEVNLYMLLI